MAKPKFPGSKALRELLRKAGANVPQVAEAIGLDKRYLWATLGGSRSCAREWFEEKIAVPLGFSVQIQTNGDVEILGQLKVVLPPARHRGQRGPDKSNISSGALVKELRRIMEYNVETLAQECHLTPGTIQALECGEQRHTVRWVVKHIAQPLGLKVVFTKGGHEIGKRTHESSGD